LIRINSGFQQKEWWKKFEHRIYGFKETRNFVPEKSKRNEKFELNFGWSSMTLPMMKEFAVNYFTAEKIKLPHSGFI
jgi:hypothetical protein